MATWEDPPYGSDDYTTLCENSKPSDFYFAISNNLAFSDDEEDEGTFIAVVPKAYFNKEKCMWDQSMQIEHLFPDDFSEAMECIWESDRSSEDVKADLIAKGFEENPAVTKASAEY